MQTAVKYNQIKRQGKRLLTCRSVEFAIYSKKNLIIGTDRPNELYKELKSFYPQANIKMIENGILINGKEK